MSVPRPEFLSGEPRFFRCDHCGNLLIQERADKPDVKATCCGEEMRELVPHSEAASQDKHLPVVTFLASKENKFANVKIGKLPHPMTEEHHIEWVYLRTSEGGQFKRMKRNIDPEVNFSLTDDDGYSYCNRPICNMGRRHCNFQCKRGFAAYIYCNVHGLWKTQM